PGTAAARQGGRFTNDRLFLRRPFAAEPGGICVSRMVRDQVRDKLDFSFEEIGEQQVKNIARPVRVYRIPIAENAPARVPLPLPDKPSIAVLPFANMSGDPEQEYFADGMVEEI